MVRTIFHEIYSNCTVRTFINAWTFVLNNSKGTFMHTSICCVTPSFIGYITKEIHCEHLSTSLVWRLMLPLQDPTTTGSIPAEVNGFFSAEQNEKTHLPLEGKIKVKEPSDMDSVSVVKFSGVEAHSLASRLVEGQ